VRASFVIPLLVLAAATTARAQPADDSLSSYLRFEDPFPLACLVTLLPPFFIQHGLELKEFVASSTFRKLRKLYGDRRAVDAIYIRAMQLTDNNTGIALLLATIATTDHRVVSLKVPLFRLAFPLSNESEEEFTRRVRNIPSALYDDGPAGGDRDKLQHFFGSSFLTLLFESPQPAGRIGEFIEEGEEALIEGGMRDDRDRRANVQGQQFGLVLLDDNRRLPSEFLSLKLASRRSASADAHCSGGGW